MKKILEALRIHRDEDEHVVEHHHTAHPPEEYRFETRDEAIGHLLTHIGQLGSAQIEEQEGSKPDSWAGRSRPASFDYGSTREGEIQGRRK